MKIKAVGGMVRIWAGFLTLALILGLMAIPASAQESGTILGTVKDTSGGSVPAAKVTVTNTDTNDMRTVTTDDDGTYRVAGLRPGRYSVKVEKEGFKTTTQSSLVLDVASQIVVNPTMEVGSATQEVTVTGEAPVINTTTSSLGNVINDQTISELPMNGRNFTDLTLLSPGVVSTTHSGLGDAGLWYSSNGAPPRSNNYMLDGAITVTKNGTGPVLDDRKHPGCGRYQGIQSRHQHVQRGIRTADGQPDGHRQQGRHQPVAWQRVRLPAQQPPGCAELLRSAAG